MVGEMDSTVTSVDFDRMLNGLDRIYSEFARACGLSDCAYWMLVDISTADEGVAVIMVSSELPEVIGVSDRILVMHEGRLKGEFYSNDVDEERIMQAAIGGAQS